MTGVSGVFVPLAKLSERIGVQVLAIQRSVQVLVAVETVRAHWARLPAVRVGRLKSKPIRVHTTEAMKRTALLIFSCALAAVAVGDPVKHNYDLKNVLWKLTIDPPRQLILGDVTNKLTLTADSSTVELSCSEINVGHAWVDGKAAEFVTKDDKLIVTLPTPGKVGDTLDVRCDYDASPVNGLYFVKRQNAFPAQTPIVYTQGEGEDNHYWLPTYDLPDDKATSESYITVATGWKAIANGAFIGMTSTESADTWHWKMAQPHSTYLISLVAGPMTKVSDDWNGIPVDFYVPPGLEEQGKASFGSTPKMIDFYSKITGVPYPYAKFSQEAVPDFMFGGMENITAVTQTARTLHLPNTEPINDSTYLVAHELAHQWFGDLITCKTWEHSWLNEGFATTLPVFLNRDWHGQDYFELDRYKNFEGAVDTIGSRGRKAVSGDVGSVPTVTMGSVYDGGCSRILMLYHMMGEETFWKAIKQFLTTYAFKNATTDDFFDVVKQVSGTDYTAFKKQWFYTSSTPSLTAKIDHSDLVITQLSPYYTLDLPVWIWNGSDWTKKSIHVDGETSKLDLGDLAGKPLLIDPEVWTPMELNYAMPFSAEDVATLYAHAPNVAQKARIINFLFDKIPQSNRIAIGHTESFQGLLQMIATHIPQAGLSYLMELTHDRDARVVNAAIVAIGNLKFNDVGMIRLQEIQSGNSNEAIREHAMQAMLNWTTTPALARKVWMMKSFDDGYRMMALDWFAKNFPDEGREKCLQFIAKSNSEAVRVKALQLLGTLKETQGSHAVFDTLVDVSKEISFRARVAAIVSLGQLGNKKAIPILKPFTIHGPGGVRGAAQASIDQLNKT